MANYKKLLIQQQSYNGTTYTNVGSVVDTYASFGIVCKEFLYKNLPEAKDIAKRDWPDEHGEDAFLPTDGIKFKAYDVEVSFLYAGEQQNMAHNIKSFIDFLYGRNTNGKPLFKYYDEYTESGRRGVYVVSVDNELYFYNDVSIDAIAEFKVKFRVTDPVTAITMNGNLMVEG